MPTHNLPVIFYTAPPASSSERARDRRRSATVIDLRDRKPGGPPEKGRSRFPMPNETHARVALARLNQAHDLPDHAEHAVAQRAANVLQRVTPAARRYGVTRVTRSREEALAQPPIILGRRRRVSLA